MTRIPVIKRIILERKTKLIHDLHCEGFSDIEIGEIVHIDRTWVYRIRKSYEQEQRLRVFSYSGWE